MGSLIKSQRLAFLAVLIFAIGFFIFQYSQNQNPVQASSSDNVSGWAWSENIGWISFNCDNPELPSPRCSGSNNYGVDLDPVTGNFSGYAWSRGTDADAGGVGWIKFDPVGSYPICPVSTCPTGSPNYAAKLDLVTGRITGWARACAGAVNADCSGGTSPESGGWDGWILLGPIVKGGIDYGVSVDLVTGDVSGFAWGSDVVGWIKFKNGIYGVKINTAALNRPPDKPGIPPGYPANGVIWNNCAIQAVSAPTFNWTYFDPDNDAQDDYQIQIDNQIGFLSPILLDYTAGFASLSYAPTSAWISANLNWNTTYYWRVKVKDDQNNWSDWSDVYSFTTLAYAYPWPGFTFSPANPKQDEAVNFQDQTVFYDSGADINHGWNWDFGDGDSSPSKNPSHAFGSVGNYCVRLQAMDMRGFSCQTSSCPPSTSLNISAPLPKWQEISPF